MATISPESPILIVSGTNRPGSFCLRVARRLEQHYAEAEIPHSFLSLLELPQALFLPESYANKPKEFEPIQRRILEAAGLHVVVPEYNGGFPGVLKLFIDHLKFPDSFEAKPVCFTGESDGRFGALRPVEQVQQIFGYRNAFVFPRRVFIADVQNQVSEDGTITNADIDRRLRDQAVMFADFVRKL